MSAPTFHPFWLHSIPQDERDEVITWLQNNGVNVDWCASFDCDGREVTAHMYTIRDGSPILENGEPVMAESIIFRPSSLPEAVRKRLMS